MKDFSYQNIELLIVEDDYDLGVTLKNYLELNKFKVIWEKNGVDALDIIKKQNFDLMILDVMMPKMDGFTLAEQILEVKPESSFLFLTARTSKEDKIKGLKLGADDYITKPFDVDEFILRIYNIIKRTKNQFDLHSNLFNINDLKIGSYILYPSKYELNFGQQTQKLTEKEIVLLLYLFENKNIMIKREVLLKHLWGNDDFFTGRSMDVFISRLRKYLSQDENIDIKSYRGIGLEFNIK